MNSNVLPSSTIVGDNTEYMPAAFIRASNTVTPQHRNHPAALTSATTLPLHSSLPYRPERDHHIMGPHQLVDTATSFGPVIHACSGHQRSQPSFVTSRTGPVASPSVKCLWDEGSCGVALDDVSPSGITRHLRDIHFSNPPHAWHNKHRGTCRWGDSCKSDAMKYESLGKHIAAVHLRSTEQQCGQCHKWFSRSDTLSRHVAENCPGS
ncbi:hypothetical protein AcV7_003563 [Taiwanofungus camphoratus]|nr:hypothetical protein AcV7_003563 [Antrodia cinnamomea]